MNWRWAGFLHLLFFAMACGETFEITSYSPEKGIVGIRCGSVCTNRLFSSFSPDDQQKITGWLADKEFENGGLSVEIEQEGDTRRRLSEISYIIAFENNSEVNFTDLTIESLVFYRRSVNNQGEGFSAAKEERISISAGESCRLKTSTVLLRNGVERTRLGPTTITSDGLSQPTYHQDKLIGMYLCISKKDRNGELITQEFEEGRVPNKDKWGEYQSAPDEAARIERDKKQALAGDYSVAHRLCTYYWELLDTEKTKYWIDKTRELIGTPTNETARFTLMELDQLDRLVLVHRKYNP